jgi:hypothetical protein
MKKQLIASLVGALILFIWQFLSWSLLNVHGAEMKYTPNQDKIMEFLTQQNLEDGTHFMPTAPPGSTQEEHQALMENSIGKPWATVSYHKAFNANMGMNMFRGFAVDLVAVFLLIWLLLKITNLDFKTALLASLAVGAIGYLTIPYLNSVWFEGNTVGYIIDTVAQWGLVGVWLGWYLARR